MRNVKGTLRLTRTDIGFEGFPDLGRLKLPLSSIEMVVKTPFFQSFTVHLDRDTVYAFEVKKDAAALVRAIKEARTSFAHSASQ